jgi:hypothetical protein
MADALRNLNPAYVRFGSKADETMLGRNVRFTPKSGQTGEGSTCPLCAKSGHCAALNSITSSARSRAEVDNSIPIALAVLRLIVNFAFMDFISL